MMEILYNYGHNKSIRTQMNKLFYGLYIFTFLACTSIYSDPGITVEIDVFIDDITQGGIFDNTIEIDGATYV